MTTGESREKMLSGTVQLVVAYISARVVITTPVRPKLTATTLTSTDTGMFTLTIPIRIPVRTAYMATNIYRMAPTSVLDAVRIDAKFVNILKLILTRSMLGERRSLCCVAQTSQASARPFPNPSSFTDPE